MKNSALLISLLFLLLASCSIDMEDMPTLIVGEEFTNSKVRVIKIDTFNVELSTFKFDSLSTSSTNRLLVGQYEDDYFGRIKSSSFFEFNASFFDIDTDAVIDSVGLILGYDKYFYSDTTKISTINIHVLTDFLKTDDEAFFNTSKIPYNQTPAATFEYYPSPNRDSLYIPLPLNFGNDVFQALIHDINNNQDLIQIFKGITVQPGPYDDASVIGFSKLNDKTYIRFYYKVPDEYGADERTFDLAISSNPLSCFNKIENSVPSSNLAPLVNQKINQNSQSTNNISYYQSGTGYATRIRFPSIKKLFDIPGEGTVLHANLQLKLKKTSYSDIFPVIDPLSIYVVDQNNKVTDQIFHSSGEAFARLGDHNEEYNELFYNVPVLRYIDRKIYQSPIVDDALILLAKENSSTVNRIIFTDPSLSEGSTTKLIISYAIYENEDD